MGYLSKWRKNINHNLNNIGYGLYKNYSSDGTVIAPPYFEDVVQWLRGDTFEDGGTTYMRDYSGNDYHAIVLDEDTIVQQTSSTDLYTADLLQGGYWFTDASTPKNIDTSDMNYEVYDDSTYYGITFANISNNTFKDIITYATARDNYEKADILRFVYGNEILFDSDCGAISDSDGNILYARKV